MEASQVRLSELDIVLLREGDICRWVRVVHANAPRSNGTQEVMVQSMEQFGRGKPRRVVIGISTFIERFM